MLAKLESRDAGMDFGLVEPVSVPRILRMVKVGLTTEDEVETTFSSAVCNGSSYSFTS